tara:strand:- start:23 stop:616 length:594 start_codon:yes stop_codon:yes gene_type:complete
MENKAISKMNKKELYEKCKKQREEIQKLSLFEDNRDELIKHNKKVIEELRKEINTTKSVTWIALSMSDLQYEFQKLKKVNEKLKEENNSQSRKIDDLKWSEGVHITQKGRAIEKLKEENENLKRYLKSARERCKTWCVDEYNRGYKEGQEQQEEVKKLKEASDEAEEMSKIAMIKNIELEEDMEELQQKYNKLYELF